MLVSALPLPKHFAWQALLLQAAVLGLYQPALPLWNTLLFSLLLAWQAWRIKHRHNALTPRQINWLLAPVLCVLLLQFKHLGMLNLMLHILLLAAVGRSFTLSQRKDAVQLIWVQYFALTCSFIFYQQIALALLIAALLGLNLYLQHRLFAAAELAIQPRRLALILCTTLPLWLGLFLLFPRLPPLWQMPNQNIASTGLSDNLDPGSIERLVQSDALAFRVSFLSARPSREDWYWRAKVYEDFDGRSWQINPRFSQQNRSAAPAESFAEVLNYQLLVEPHYQRDLFSLGLPLSWSEPVKARPAGLVTYSNTVAQRISYQLTSVLKAIPVESAAEQQLNLRQHNANPQARRFGQQLANQYPGDSNAIVQALAAHFQQNAFYYTLTPPRLGNNAIDQFLFESRSGFCSHYASASAVILRAAGIPARVVGGYQGGDWQQNQQYLLVRQRDAHAWVEYLHNAQWQRFDPTAAIAPERILAGLEQTLTLSERALLNGWQDNWLGKLAMQWSHLDYFWSVWVLGFNQRDQQRLWQQLANWQHWSTFLISLLLATAVTIVWLVWFFWRTEPVSPNRLRQQLCKALASEPEAGTTVSSWLQHYVAHYPEHALLFDELRNLYERSVFANDEQAAKLLQQRLKQQRRLLKTLRI
ncbi:transglutaminase family protein [Alishewanella longhuensis]